MEDTCFDNPVINLRLNQDVRCDTSKTDVLMRTLRRAFDRSSSAPHLRIALVDIQLLNYVNPNMDICYYHLTTSLFVIVHPAKLPELLSETPDEMWVNPTKLHS
jgi:hypothetical protein